MEFLVKLIRVTDFPHSRAKNALKENCTFVKSDLFIFEGDEESLAMDGVVFDILGEGVVGPLGDLSQAQLIQLCKDTFKFDHSFLEGGSRGK